MTSPPWVVIERLKEEKPVLTLRRKRLRGKINRRMFFSRIKQNDVRKSSKKQHRSYENSADVRDFKGFDDESFDSDTDFKGFDLQSISTSYNKWLVLCESLQDPFLEAIQKPQFVLSVYLSESVNVETSTTFIYKVIPLKKKPMRVLSLFDGIATGLHILKNVLKIKIEIYFSSEIDENALRLQRANFFGEIIQLGDVRALDKGLETGEGNVLLDSLGRIDLLIGGSPCENLSRVNPARLGLKDTQSSGNLFFSFCRIRDYFIKRMAVWEEPLLWFFENTAHLDAPDKADMILALGCEPVTCCASSYFPAPRKRHYWGNLPRLKSNLAIVKKQVPKTLQQILGPSRKALVKKVPTITTQGFSRKTGARKVCAVLENGHETNLKITDYEAMLGFPKSFTDEGSLTITQRKKLLGKSWCIPVVSQLLSALPDIFQTVPFQDDIESQKCKNVIY